MTDRRCGASSRWPLRAGAWDSGPTGRVDLLHSFAMDPYAVRSASSEGTGTATDNGTTLAEAWLGTSPSTASFYSTSANLNMWTRPEVDPTGRPDARSSRGLQNDLPTTRRFPRAGRVPSSAPVSWVAPPVNHPVTMAGSPTATLPLRPSRRRCSNMRSRWIHDGNRPGYCESEAAHPQLLGQTGARSPVVGILGGGSLDSTPSSWTSAVGFPSENHRALCLPYGSEHQSCAL